MLLHFPEEFGLKSSAAVQCPTTKHHFHAHIINLSTITSNREIIIWPFIALLNQSMWPSICMASKRIQFKQLDVYRKFIMCIELPCASAFSSCGSNATIFFFFFEIIVRIYTIWFVCDAKLLCGKQSSFHWIWWRF